MAFACFAKKKKNQTAIENLNNEDEDEK